MKQVKQIILMNIILLLILCIFNLQFFSFYQSLPLNEFWFYSSRRVRKPALLLQARIAINQFNSVYARKVRVNLLISPSVIDKSFDIAYFGDSITTLSGNIMYFVPFAQLIAIIDTAPSDIEITDGMLKDLLLKIISDGGNVAILGRNKYKPQEFYSKYWRFEKESKLNLLALKLAIEKENEDILAILSNIKVMDKEIAGTTVAATVEKIKRVIGEYEGEAMEVVNESKIDINNYSNMAFKVVTEPIPNYILSLLGLTDDDQFFIGNPQFPRDIHIGIKKSEPAISELNEYTFNFPLFITDQHSGVYFWLKDAVEQEILSSTLPIIIFDSHTDENPETRLPSDLNEVNWLEFTKFDDLVSRSHDVVMQWLTESNEERLIAQLEALPSDITAIISIDLDYFGVVIYEGIREDDYLGAYKLSDHEIDKEISRIIETIKNKNINVVALNISLSRKYSPYSMNKQDEILRKLLLALQEL